MSASPPIPSPVDILAGSGLQKSGNTLSTSFDPTIVTDVGDKNASTYTLVSESLTTGTSQPLSIADAVFIYNVAGGAINGNGTTGVVSAIFASSGAETGTGANQGGLGSTASATQPYNNSYFPGQRGVTAQLRNQDGDEIVLSEMLSTAPMADRNAKVYGYLSYRSDLGTNLKWRLWFYYRASATGYETPFTPDTSLTNVKLYSPTVYLLLDLPVGAGLGGPIVDGDAAAVLGPKSVGTTELDDLAVTSAKIAAGAVTAAKLADTTVTPGAYTSANITVDQQGRITLASNGLGGPTLPLSKANGGFGQDVSTGLTNDYVAIVSGGAITIGAVTSSSLTTALTTSPPITLSAGNSLTLSAGSGGIAAGSGTGNWAMPTGSGSWAGASGKTLSLTSTAAAITIQSTTSGTVTINSAGALNIGANATTVTLGGISTTVGITGKLNLNSGTDLTTSVGVSDLDFSASTGATWFPTGNIFWSGASNKSLSLSCAGTGAFTLNAGTSGIQFQRSSTLLFDIGASSGTALTIGSNISLSASAGTGALSLGSMTGTWAMPTGTGTITSSRVNLTQAAVSGSTANGFIYTGGAHTTLTTGTEKPDWDWAGNRTVQFATGALTTQRQYLFRPATYAFVGASTLTTAATVAITDAPAAGTNATITNAYALWVQAGRAQFDGTLGLATGQTLVVGSNTLIGAVTDKLNAGMLAIASQATGDILYANATTTFARLGIGSTGQVLTVAGGVPSWATPSVIPAVSISVTAASGSISSFASWYPSSPTFFTTTGEASGWISYVPSGSTWKIRMSVDGAVPGGETLTMQARFCATINGTWSDLGSAITRVNADGTAVVESAVLTPGSAGYISFKATYTSGSTLASITHMEVERVS